MGIIFSIVMLIGALINGFLGGFTSLNIVYIVLPVLLGIASHVMKMAHLSVAVGKVKVNANLVAFIAFAIVLVIASKAMAPDNQFTVAQKIDASAKMIARDDYKGAKKILVALNQKAPANEMVNLNLGVIYLKERKPDLAKQHLDLASGRLQFDENLWFNYGMMYYQVNDFKNAQIQFERALKLNPSMTSAAVYAGTMSFRLRELQKAIYYLTSAHFLNPESPEILLHLGRAHFELMNFNASEIAYQAALSLKPSKAVTASIEGLLVELEAARGGVAP